MIIDQELFFFEKQTNFVFIKSKCLKHWKGKATGFSFGTKKGVELSKENWKLLHMGLEGNS